MGRPIGVTILAIGAALLAVINGIIMIRFLGFLPFLGPLDVRVFNLWYAFLYGLLAYVWAWLTGMLWNVDPQAWMFLAVIVVFNLCIDFLVLITGGTWYDINVSVILNGLLLVYLMLPGVRSAFGTD